MTKSKRQLRAEAVERLRNMDDWCDGTKVGADYIKALLWDLRVIDEEHVRDALIDLLTDDEPPEGGEMSGTLRETPEFAENPQKSARNGKNDDFNDTREKLLMDIQQESYMFYTTNGEGPCAESVPWSSVLRWLDRQAAITERDAFMRGRASLDDEFAELTAERNGLASDLYAEHALVVQLQSDVERLQAERDEWKAKTDKLTERMDKRENTMRRLARLIDVTPEAEYSYNGDPQSVVDGGDFGEIATLVFGAVRRLMSERDEWKAKAEQLANADLPAENDVRPSAVDAAETRFDNDMSQLERERDYWKEECRDMLSEFYDTESEPCPMLEYPRPASACAPSILAMAVRQGMDERIAELELLVRDMWKEIDSTHAEWSSAPFRERMRGLGMEVDE